MSPWLLLVCPVSGTGTVSKEVWYRRTSDEVTDPGFRPKGIAGKRVGESSNFVGRKYRRT